MTATLCLIAITALGAVRDTTPFANDSKWKTSILFVDGTRLKGRAIGNSDSTITLIVPGKDSTGQRKIVDIPFYTIQKMTIRDGNKLTKGGKIIGGAAIGFLLGFLLGGKDCDAPNSDCNFFEDLFANQSVKGRLTLGAFSAGLMCIFAVTDKERVTFKFRLGRNNKQKIKMPTF